MFEDFYLPSLDKCFAVVKAFGLKHYQFLEDKSNILSAFSVAKVYPHLALCCLGVSDLFSYNSSPVADSKDQYNPRQKMWPFRISPREVNSVSDVLNRYYTKKCPTWLIHFLKKGFFANWVDYKINNSRSEHT